LLPYTAPQLRPAAHKLRRQQSISGESFAMAAQVLLDKWTARGCDPSVLTKIRTDVFDIAAPK
jgi:hypothetical protein